VSFPEFRSDLRLLFARYSFPSSRLFLSPSLFLPPPAFLSICALCRAIRFSPPQRQNFSSRNFSRYFRLLFFLLLGIKLPFPRDSRARDIFHSFEVAARDISDRDKLPPIKINRRNRSFFLHYKLNYRRNCHDIENGDISK